MIVFETVRWKNFLSTGNYFTEIYLNRNPSTLIVGQNGSGKSTLLDALSFGLFGKPNRNINKPQLVNTINKKECLVEVEFKIANVKFKIIRGINPAIFEIYQNDKMINQSSNVRDYQKFLKQNILHLNHKSFHQIVVLGSSSFIPFMQLPAYQRREVIEDILDIQIFSKMNMLLRESFSKTKEDLKNVNHQIELCTQKIDIQKKHIKEMRELAKEQIEQKRKDIESNQNDINELVNENQEIELTLNQEKYKDLEFNLEKFSKKAQDLKSYNLSFNTKIKNLVKETKFYENNENCPTCLQFIDDDFKNTKIQDSKEQAKELSDAIAISKKEYEEANDRVLELKNHLEEYRDYLYKVKRNNEFIDKYQKTITKINNSITELNISGEELSRANEDFNKAQEEKNILLDNKSKLSEERSYNEALSEMLKDTGIKTKIIKQYIPVMNKLINYYLGVLDFFVSFNINDSFQEEIKSRYRDEFTYDSFSEGEKQRIDLALLFTWRHIAKMKNSTNTNLLILDETFDSSMDVDGVENLMKILDTLDEQTNVFVISHKGELLESKFRNKIEFIKEKNFSKKVIS